jgi:hypothetical protein
MSMGERIKVLITVKAYPSASVKYGEAVCVAGVRTGTDAPRWVRLYPVQYRDLPIDKRFGKYEEIGIDASNSNDSRPESVRPDCSTIELLRKVPTGKDRQWTERRRYVEPLLVESMCAALAGQQATGRSLAAFCPGRVLEVAAEPETTWDEKQLSILNQMSLFAQDKSVLEKIPWRFSYRYSCGGACKGHKQTIIDWEIHQAYRKWRDDFGDADAAQRVQLKWLDELCGPAKDTAFFVGNQFRHPESFLVLGVFWPPKASKNGHNLQLGLHLQ